MKRRSNVAKGRFQVALGWVLAPWLAIACMASPASAQEPDGPFYDGTWNMRMRCLDGSACQARVVISDYAGTWQDLSGKSAAKRACGGKKMPLTVQSSTRSLLAFTAFGDGLPAPCPTLTVEVKPLDEKTLEGTIDSDGHGAESAAVHARHAALSGSGAAAGAEPEKAGAAGATSARPIRLERR
jgi:hypothetical protein